jgi:ABC-type uncharacterized transport system permease subunit
MSRLKKDVAFPLRGLLTELTNESFKRPEANFLEHVKYNVNDFINLSSNLWKLFITILVWWQVASSSDCSPATRKFHNAKL